MNTRDRKKYGLVLEGGGARGAYHIGVWKALKELKIEIEGVAGTSVGALNGAMIVQDDFDVTYDFWYNMTPSKVLNVDEELLEKLKMRDISYKDIKNIVMRVKNIVNDKGIDITPLKNTLKKYINEEKIRESSKDFGMVTISITDIKSLELFIEDIPKDQLINYLLASARFPIFKQEKLDGKLFLDGGLYDNLPINLLAKKGYKDFIVVKLNSPGKTRRIKEKGLNITYIKPTEGLGRILDFSQYGIRRKIEMGYFDTIKTFNKLKGKKYYIKPTYDEKYFLEFFLNIEEDTIKELGKMLGIENIPSKRMLFEHIIPKLAILLDINNEDCYEDIVLGIFEEAAKRCNINKYKIYTFEDLREEVIQKYKPISKHNLIDNFNIINSNNLVLKVRRKEILDKIINELF